MACFPPVWFSYAPFFFSSLQYQFEVGKFIGIGALEVVSFFPFFRFCPISEALLGLEVKLEGRCRFFSFFSPLSAHPAGFYFSPLFPAMRVSSAAKRGQHNSPPLFFCFFFFFLLFPYTGLPFSFLDRSTRKRKLKRAAALSPFPLFSFSPCI